MAYYKKYLDYLVDKTFRKTKWGYVVFFVTNKCNAKCKHCFYWKNLNSQSKELSLEEIEKITKKTGKIQVLLLSGGEPFLRKDLGEIISLFIKNNKIKVVSIPTNAILKQEITTTVSKLSERFPKVLFSVNPSIDNLYEKNDKIRGVKGGFNKSIETLKELINLKEKRKNIEVVVNTTISNQNYMDIDKIIDFFKKFNITYHNFELLRGNPKEKNINLPNLKDIKEIHKKALKLRDYYINKTNKKGVAKFLEKIAVLGITKYTQKIKEDILDSEKLPFTCSAGKNIFVLEPDGEVRLCELLPSVGNIKDYDYDINKLLKNNKSKEIFKTAKNCKCTHVCFINMSIANDTKTLFKVPYYFLKWKLQ